MAGSNLRKVAGILQAASPAAIEDAASRLGATLPQASWLSSSNPYLRHAPQEVSKQLKGRARSKVLGRRSANAAYLAEYVAASVILHCADGWAYLGRAMAAQLRGDIGAARHLGYYAELRAAMSLLASQGVGVFNYKHVLVKVTGDVEVFAHRGTHRFAWEALEAWSETNVSAQTVTGLIKPSDVSLAEWLEAFTSGSMSTARGKTYLMAWGLDVQRFGADRDARNESSYQPRTIAGAAAPPTTRAVAFTSDLWDAFEPVGADNFGKLDLHLLRRSFERLFRERTGNTAKRHPGEFRRYVQQALGSVAASMPSERLEAFLMREIDSSDPTLIEDAEHPENMHDPEDHLHVMARAALLLRVSSGCARSLLVEAQLEYGDFEWWSEQLGASRALVRSGQGLESPVDLWNDVDDALTELAGGVSNGASVDYWSLHDQCARQLSVLGGCERIALWGLAA